ncbi:MAG: hypothetical protein JSR77_11240 [Planctomycetes bacterium]|nr:hypothetical protein [Planctomycetota bacterium]
MTTQELVACLPAWATPYAGTVAMALAFVWIIVETAMGSREKVAGAMEKVKIAEERASAAERERDLFRGQAISTKTHQQRGKELIERGERLYVPGNYPVFYHIGGFSGWLADVAQWSVEATQLVQEMAPDQVAAFLAYPPVESGSNPQWTMPHELIEPISKAWALIYTRTLVLNHIIKGGTLEKSTASPSPDASSPSASPPSSPSAPPPPNPPQS